MHDKRMCKKRREKETGTTVLQNAGKGKIILLNT